MVIAGLFIHHWSATVGLGWYVAAVVVFLVAYFWTQRVHS